VLELINCLCWIRIRKVLWVTFDTKENYHSTTLCARDITRHFFSNMVVSRCLRTMLLDLNKMMIMRWNLLDHLTVDAPSLNAFKNGLSRIRDNRMCFFMV